MDTKDRIAVVTGAAGGIGGAIVRGLVAEGARAVVATDLAVSGVEELAAELNGDTATAAGGARVFPRHLDVSDELATRALVDEIDDSVGPIDLWFANAGLSGGGGPEASDLVWERQWQVNVMAHVYAARALLPGWVARGEGHLVTTASMAGLLTSLGDGVYAATKHAAVGLAEWLAITYADQGVKVSCVCPGAVDTNMLRGGAGGDADKAAAAIGGGDVLDPSGAAAAILEGVREDRFLIYTHPDLKRYLVGKTDDTERWIKGMSRLWKRTQDLLGEEDVGRPRPGTPVAMAVPTTQRTRFDRFADRTAKITSRASFFVLCLLMVLLWLPSFFLIRDGDTWQLVIGTITNVLTFLLVALIQNTQWRSEKAVNVKLNAIAEGLADLMRFQMGEDSDLTDDLAELKATVGLEDRVSPTQ